MLKRIAFACLVVLIVALFGCGGGGGGGGGNGGGPGGGNGGTFGSIRVETVDGSGNFVDPTNIQVGQTVHFQLAHYNTTTAARQTVAVNGGWSTTDTTNSVGTLASDGTFTATASSNTIFTASATASVDGVLYQGFYKVKPQGAVVKGFLIDSNGFRVPGVVVILEDGAGAEVSRTTSAGDGRIYAATPTTATKFTLLSSSVNTTVYNQFFTYLSKGYSTLIGTCVAPLPALTLGVTTNLPGNVALYAIRNSGGTLNPPPPPPNGCP